MHVKKTTAPFLRMCMYLILTTEDIYSDIQLVGSCMKKIMQTQNVYDQQAARFRSFITT